MPHALPRTAARHDRRTRRVVARVKASLSTLVVLTLATASVVAGGAAATQAATVNPLAGASGFTVVSFGDVELSNHEIEGSVAAGGNVHTEATNPYNMIHQAAGNGSYTLPVFNSMPVRLVAGGTFDRANSTTIIRVSSSGSTGAATEGRVVLGSAGANNIASRGSGVCIQDIGQTSCSGAALEQSSFAQTPAQVVAPTAFSTLITPAEIADLTSLSDQIADGDLLNTVAVTLSPTGSERTLTLTDNKTNVWTVNAADLPTGDWKLKFGTVKPSLTAPLVVRVIAADGATINLPIEVLGSTDAPGSSNNNNFARFVLWNIQQAENQTATLHSNGIVAGSVLAPHTNLITASGSKTLIEGQLVGKSVSLQNTGEIHHYTFTPLLEFAVADPTGSFSISKALSGPAGLVPGTTQFTVNYSVNGGTPIPLTLLADGTAVTVDDLPDGATVTFDEPTYPTVSGVTWTGKTFSPSTITIDDAAVPTVTLTNTYTATPAATGSFSISKALSGPAGLVPGTTQFTVNYSVNGGTPIPLTLLADGTAVTVDNLPDGATVTFDEETPPVIAGVTWTGASFNDDSITIDDAAVATVTLTNTYTATTVVDPTGSFSIHKELDGPTALVPADTTFTVEYQVDGGAPQTLTITADGSATIISDLPDGATVTFDEPTYPAVPGVRWTFNTFDYTTITIVGGTTTAVTLTNTYVHDPSIDTQAYVNGIANGTVNPNHLDIVDLVHYENLLPGHAYRLEGEVVYLDGTTIVSTGITNSVLFTSGAAAAGRLLADGDVESRFSVPLSLLDELDGKKLFIFQTLFDGTTEVLFDGAVTGTDPWFATTPEWVRASLVPLVGSAGGVGAGAGAGAGAGLGALAHAGVDGVESTWLIAIAALLLGTGLVGAGALRRRRHGAHRAATV